MKLKPQYNHRAAKLPHIEGDIIVYNYYDCEVTLTPSNIRSLQTNGKKKHGLWQDLQTEIVPLFVDSYSTEYSVRCSQDTLRKAVKIARLGYDVDLRPFSGTKAKPLENIAPLIQSFPKESIRDIIIYFAPPNFKLKP